MNRYTYILLLLGIVFIIQTILWLYVFPALYIEMIVSFFEIFLVGFFSFLLIKKYILNKVFRLIYIYVIITVFFNFICSYVCSNQYIDRSFAKGVDIVEKLDSFKLNTGNYPNDLKVVFNNEDLLTPINTPFVYLNQGSYYFLQFDWVEGYVAYYNYNEKRWLLILVDKKKNPSKVIRYKLRTW